MSKLQALLEGDDSSTRTKPDADSAKASGKAAAKAPNAAAPAPQSQPAPAAEPGEDDTIEEAGDERLPKNFRFHTENPQRSRYLKLLRQQPEANPIDLAVQAGYTPSQAKVEAAAAAAAPAPAVPAEITTLKDEIAALKAKKAEHKAAYEFGEADDVNDQILEKTLKLQRREDEIEAEQAFQQEYQGQYVTARTQASQKYPDALKKGTPQFEEVVRERAYLEQTEPGFFDNPEYPTALIERLEKRRPDLFKGAAAPAPAGSQPAAPAPVVTPPPNARPNNAARPVGAVVQGSEGSQTPLTKEATEAAIDDLSIEQLEALGDMVGTKGPAVRGKNPGIKRG
jgi:hypothetical protein